MSSPGLRPAVLLSAGLLFLGKALHTLPFIGRTIDTLLMYVGQIIYSLSFGVSLGVPTLVSAIWFPANERTTATAIGTLSPSIGMASGFLTAPLFVPYSNSKRHNGSTSNTSNHLLGDIRRHFKELMYLQVQYFTFTRETFNKKVTRTLEEGGRGEGVNRTLPPTSDTIHPIDMIFGTYNEPPLFFQLSVTM